MYCEHLRSHGQAFPFHQCLTYTIACDPPDRLRQINMSSNGPIQALYQAATITLELFLGRAYFDLSKERCWSRFPALSKLRKR
jgi:hypothetical protein